MKYNPLRFLCYLHLYRTLLVICLAWLNPVVPGAQAGARTVTTPHVTASLISERDSIEAGQSFWLALHFDIIDGWHTYWQNPGDSGEAPRIQWQLPSGFTVSEIHWPYPQRLPVGPLMNYGYSNEAWLLVHMTAPDNLAVPQISINASAEWLVCEEECIPENGQFQLSLAVAATGNSLPSAWADRIQAIQQHIPQASPGPSSISVQQHQIDLQVSIDQLNLAPLQDVYFFPGQYGIVDHAAKQTYTLTDQTLSLQIPRGDLKAQPLNQLQGVLVLSERLADGTGTRAFAINSMPKTGTSLQGFLTIIAFALLGGLLLNIMPCVFPILSLKAMSIMQTAAQQPTRVRRNGVVFTAGILISFALIAGILLLLRSGGEAIGWGFQLQSPVFVLTLIWLIFAMGLQFSGLWSFGENWMGTGQGLTSQSSYLGTFFTGVLAVVVATPCTAPFMGTALGYAISQPAWIAMLIFLSLGLGMALPWLLISLWPTLSRYLPKPGAWMEYARQALAFPLYATAAWLLWVLAQQVDQQSLLYALLSLVCIAMALWFWQNTRQGSRAWHITALVTLLSVVVLMSALLWKLEPATTALTNEQQSWEQYNPDTLSRYRAEGKAVLLNFTAAWCITCLVNEKLVLGTPEIQMELRDKGVVYIKGDWTNRDPAITRVLEQYGRSGVPLYLLFPKDRQGQVIVLPNILTKGIVQQNLRLLD